MHARAAVVLVVVVLTGSLVLFFSFNGCFRNTLEEGETQRSSAELSRDSTTHKAQRSTPVSDADPVHLPPESPGLVESVLVSDNKVSTEEMSTEEVRAFLNDRIDELAALGGRDGIAGILDFLRSLPHNQLTARAFDYAGVAIRQIVEDNPGCFDLVYGTFLSEKHDLVQMVLFWSLIHLPQVGSEHDPWQEMGFEYDLLTVYQTAGPITRRNIAGNVVHFRNYEVVDAILDDAIAGQQLGDVAALMHTVVCFEETMGRRRLEGRDPFPDLELRKSCQSYVDQLVGIMCTSDALGEVEAQECLEGLANLKPSALLRVESCITEPRFSRDFVSWSHAFIHEKSDDEPMRPPG